MTQDSTIRRLADGSIDFGHYRARARTLHREARNDTIRKLWALLIAAFAYFKFPQKRWMRRQASSKSSVLVA